MHLLQFVTAWARYRYGSYP